MYRVLDENQIERIHEASLEVLEGTGIQVDNPRAVEIFRRHGAAVVEGGRVRLPRALVESAMALIPSEFTLFGRRTENHAHYEPGCFYTSTGGSAMYVLDRETGERRHSTCKDLHEIVSLVDRLPEIDLISLPIYLNDLPKDVVDVNRFYAGLRNSTKHVIGAVYTVEGLLRVARMAEIVAGSAWTDRPPVSIVLCPLISPLRLDHAATEILIEAAERGIVTHNFSMAQVGCTAPMTLAGTLVVLNAEVLAVTTLLQLIRPRIPALYCSVPGLTDMRTGLYVTGGIESALLNVGATQLAQRYRMPNWATAARTDAKIPDAQAGYEHALTVPYVVSAGASHVTCGAGFLDFVLTVSFEQYVIDNEIIGMVRRMRQGLRVDEEALAEKLVAAVGPGGNYLGEEHTVRHMRDELYRPLLSNRQERSDWVRDGAKDTWQRAREIVSSLIRDHVPIGLTEDQEAEILDSIEGVVRIPA